uniref:Odorant-binding protein 15 n=1 Tax=Chouioia cunea TaxID=1570515 RepID=A0A6B9CJL4_9HYME|nr:odorant-binding protein 15 [Chouioia cunea]
MKLLLALCVAICFAGVYCDTAPKPEEVQYVKDCASKNNMDQKMIDDLKMQKTFFASQAAMCFTHCVMHHNGMLDDEGNMTDMFKKIPEAAECQSMTGNDKCETAAKIMDCMVKKENADMKDLNL